MKKFLSILSISFFVCSFASIALAAISAKDAEDIVQQEYPAARILSTEIDEEDGILVYEVEFQTSDIRKGELVIAKDDGKILERKLKYY